MKASDLLKVLQKTPLSYHVERQKGSHRRLVSDAGYPPITFSFHDNATIPRSAVKKVLTKDVGLTMQEALALV